MKTIPTKKVECPYCNEIGPGHGKIYNGKTERVNNEMAYMRQESFAEYKEWDAPATDWCPFCDWGETTLEKAAQARIALEERNNAKEQYDALQRRYGF